MGWYFSKVIREQYYTLWFIPPNFTSRIWKNVFLWINRFDLSLLFWLAVTTFLFSLTHELMVIALLISLEAKLDHSVFLPFNQSSTYFLCYSPCQCHSIGRCHFTWDLYKKVFIRILRNSYSHLPNENCKIVWIACL